jgi:hypothetical protein
MHFGQNAELLVVKAGGTYSYYFWTDNCVWDKDHVTRASHVQWICSLYKKERWVAGRLSGVEVHWAVVNTGEQLCYAEYVNW